MTKPWWREPTRGQWCSFLAAWLGWVMDAFDFTVFLLVMPRIAKEFGVSMTATAGSITLTLLVRLIGGFAAGAAADRWGRRLPLMLSIVWFALCDGAVAFAPSFAVLLILRTLFGFGMGAEWTSGATLAMENWPARSRGIASGLLQGSWAIGYLLAAQASAFIVPRYGWRALFLVAAAPALLALPIRIWVPESPEWKHQQQRWRRWSSVRDLFSPGVLRMLAWASIVMALGFGVYYAMTGLYPTMLATERGIGAGGIANLVALFNIGMLVGSVAAGVLAVKKGVVAAVIAPAVIMIPLLPLYVAGGGWMLYVGAFLGGAFGVGFCGVTPVFLTGMFPAHVRARAVGIVYHAGAFLAAFVPLGIAALAEHSGLSLATAIAVVAGAGEALLALSLLVPAATRVAVAPAAANH